METSKLRMACTQCRVLSVELSVYTMHIYYKVSLSRLSLSGDGKRASYERGLVSRSLPARVFWPSSSLTESLEQAEVSLVESVAY